MLFHKNAHVPTAASLRSSNQRQPSHNTPSFRWFIHQNDVITSAKIPWQNEMMFFFRSNLSWIQSIVYVGRQLNFYLWPRVTKWFYQLRRSLETVQQHDPACKATVTTYRSITDAFFFSNERHTQTMPLCCDVWCAKQIDRHTAEFHREQFQSHICLRRQLNKYLSKAFCRISNKIAIYC